MWAERLRFALLAVDPSRLNLAVPQSAAPPAAPGHPPAAVVAIRALKRHGNPAGVLGEGRFRPAVAWIAPELCDPCLTAIRAELGDHADDPAPEQLASALEAARGRFSETDIALTLVVVASGDAPAAGLCRELLASEAVPGPGDAAQPPVAPPPARPVDNTDQRVDEEAKREQRRSRRHEAREQTRRSDAVPAA